MSKFNLFSDKDIIVALIDYINSRVYHSKTIKDKSFIFDYSQVLFYVNNNLNGYCVACFFTAPDKASDIIRRELNECIDSCLVQQYYKNNK